MVEGREYQSPALVNEPDKKENLMNFKSTQTLYTTESASMYPMHFYFLLIDIVLSFNSRLKGISNKKKVVCV